MYNKKQFFLQFGTIGQPMRTMAVDHTLAPMNHHTKGLSYTATGYGSKIPTQYKVEYNGRFYRVYCRIYSNSGTCYIVSNGEQIRVTEYN